MDCFTEINKDWLDQRFKYVDEEGIYFAHQPIYGFRKGHSERGVITKYIITFQIMKALSHLKCSSLLDVGGAEGYKAALIRHLFNIDVKSCDLSKEACSRAKELYDIDGQPIDIHNLPFKDNEFEVVLCSETLEHVPDLQHATRELLRVSSKAVIITVPHEAKKVIEKNIIEKTPHAHIHSMDMRSFDFALSDNSKIISMKILNKFTNILKQLAEASEMRTAKGYPMIIVNIYNLFVPILSVIFGKRSVRLIVLLDDLLCKLIPIYNGMLFIIIKDDQSYSDRQQKNIRATQIIDFNIPYHYLGRKQ